MKIKKAFDICKKSKVISLFTDGTTQYLSDGNAVYPLTALPENASALFLHTSTSAKKLMLSVPLSRLSPTKTKQFLTR